MTLTARRMHPISLFILGVAWATQVPAAVTDVTQTFVLQPGWNSVFLEVRPEANEAEAVFGGLPLASAWTWNPAGPKVEFIDDPSEQLVRSPQWLGYFPRPRPESILTNLFAVQANRAYLLKIDGNQPVTWTVTGTPEVQSYRWAPDSFNLVGFSGGSAAATDFWPVSRPVAGARRAADLPPGRGAVAGGCQSLRYRDPVGRGLLGLLSRVLRTTADRSRSISRQERESILAAAGKSRVCGCAT